MIALAVATASLLGGRAAPATASSLVAQIEPAAALGSGFTYRGSLTRAGQLVEGANACGMGFSLWDAASGSAQLGAAQTVDGVDFAQGLFTLSLNAVHGQPIDCLPLATYLASSWFALAPVKASDLPLDGLPYLGYTVPGR